MEITGTRARRGFGLRAKHFSSERPDISKRAIDVASLPKPFSRLHGFWKMSDAAIMLFSYLLAACREFFPAINDVAIYDCIVVDHCQWLG